MPEDEITDRTPTPYLDAAGDSVRSAICVRIQGSADEYCVVRGTGRQSNGLAVKALEIDLLQKVDGGESRDRLRVTLSGYLNGSVVNSG